MLRRLEHPTKETFTEIALDDVTVTLRSGKLGSSGDAKVIDDDDMGGLPPNVFVKELAAELRTQGYVDVLLENLAEHIENGHGVTLTGALREFFERGGYRRHQGKECPSLGCHLDFASDAVQGDFHQQYFDLEAKAPITLIPIASKIVDGLEEEQQWIGMQPGSGDGPVYRLYTSGSFELLFDTFAELLADLK